MTHLGEIFRAFLKLGLTSFGGPIAHIGYFRKEFVETRKWIDDAAYADLVALCQFLPGPASSQVVFGLGMRRGGLAGALTASLCFTMPSAILMILFGYGILWMGDFHQAGWLQGLKVAAVAVVAQALIGMTKALTPDKIRVVIAFVVALISLLYPGPAGQLGSILGGSLLGYLLFRSDTQKPEKAVPHILGHRWAIGAISLFFILFILFFILVKTNGNSFAKEFYAFYRTGSLVFGGGHVVLPLLRAEVVAPGWVSDSAFLAGYGIAQALPGPLFTFAAYLGTLSSIRPNGWSGGLWCLFAIYLPTWLMVGGFLPFWERLRSLNWMKAALKGSNAAVVGILFAAFYNPLWVEGIRGISDFLVGLAAFSLLQYVKLPAWLVVILCAAAGQTVSLLGKSVL
ncbi:MAG: chromate efflux transporter [Chthoniobacterales bacterium]